MFVVFLGAPARTPEPAQRTVMGMQEPNGRGGAMMWGLRVLSEG